jgi:hypothetical protein
VIPVIRGLLVNDPNMRLLSAPVNTKSTLAPVTGSAYIAAMGKPAPSEPQTRQSVTLPDTMWEEIDAVRRAAPGRIPSKQTAIRSLLREALDNRAKKAGRPPHRGA